MNEISSGDIIPEKCKTEVVINIYKKGARDKAENYREIFPTDLRYKTYAEIIRNSLDDDLKTNNKLSDSQMGFRSGRGTIDASDVLKSVVSR